MLAEEESNIITLIYEVNKWREEGHIIVFTNGVFDLLHPGHLHCLNSAKSFGTKLIVGVNDDGSVKRLKGDSRPVNNEIQRSTDVSEVECVDTVIIFSADTPLTLVTYLNPSVLVKGGDYNPNCREETDPKYIVGSNEVIASGGSIEIIPTLKGHSTTEIIESK